MLKTTDEEQVKTAKPKGPSGQMMEGDVLFCVFFL